MNNLLLFRMYQRFRRWRKHASVCRGYDRRGNPDLGIAVDSDRYACEWQKWETLSEMTREALEKRLAPPADDSLQHFADAVAYWAQPTLYVVPKEERSQ